MVTGPAARRQQVAGPARHRALTALLLLHPGTPMLFQGQEYDASSPFFYFADHRPDLAAQVVLLVDGAYAVGGSRRDPAAARQAKAAAAVLLASRAAT